MPDECFRNAAAIAHAVPGARIRLGLPGGSHLVVAGDADADLRPCQFRHVLLAEDVHGETACSRHISSCQIEGELRMVGPGLYQSHLTPLWCFVTTLGLDLIRQMLAELETELCPERSSAAAKVGVVIKPDSSLGVGVVTMRGANDELVTDLVSRLAGKCLASEVQRAVPG